MLVSITRLAIMLCLLDKFVIQSKHNKNSTEKLLRAILKPKVVNGEAATLGEIPYQVAFKGPTQGNRYYMTFCGGSIVKEKIVVSAAHCFIPSKISLFKYCTGRLDTSHYRTTYAVAGNLENKVRYTGTNTAGQWKRLKFIAFPSSYHFPIDDIAVVHLTKSFTFDNYVAAIPYAQEYKNYLGLQCLASGYGRTSPKTQAYNLQKAHLEIMSDSVCNRVFGRKMKKFVCTVDRVTNVLQGDSGGPLVCKDTGDPAEGAKGVLVGIVSGGTEGRGTLFTRVSSFRKYIARGKANINIIISSHKSQYLLLLLCILFC